MEIESLPKKTQKVLQDHPLLKKALVGRQQRLIKIDFKNKTPMLIFHPISVLSA